MVLADNVSKFIDRASIAYGQLKANYFAGEMVQNCYDIVTASPIEQMFWVAIHAMAESLGEALNPEPQRDKHGRDFLVNGVYLAYQRPIGKYRPDFVLSQIGIGPDDFYAPVVIELDGHDFHDRNKQQRSYEKARDRFFVKQGYKVLHYTGSDINADPFKAAHEALEMIGATVGYGATEYDPKDPLGTMFR